MPSCFALEPRRARAALTFSNDVLMVPIIVEADAAVESEPVVEIVTIDPERLMFSPSTVIVLPPSAEISGEGGGGGPSTRVTPLNEAFSRMLVIWSRSDTKSSFNVLRLAV